MSKRKIGRLLMGIIIIGCIFVLSINFYVVMKEKGNIIYKVETEDISFDVEEIQKIKSQGADCILVLGAGVRPDGTPTPMLKDRLDTGIALYKSGVAPKILLSGDNGQDEYNEIHTMLNYTLGKDIKSQDVFCDHAGFSTYDSMYRAKTIFQAKKVIVVTQTYHQYRALYIGNELGIETKAVSADQKRYPGQIGRDLREILARDKDFVKVMAKKGATLGGETIPISGSGILSHGE
ncbi:MAG: ElyC/SanA/YdcF family protein [Anaerovoracaceae bacterium]